MIAELTVANTGPDSYYVVTVRLCGGAVAATWMPLGPRVGVLDSADDLVAGLMVGVGPRT